MVVTNRVDLALINGKIVTVNKNNDLTEAVAVKGSKIVGVGTTSEIKELVNGNTTVIDLKGKTVTPGFVESHCHPSEAGTGLVFEVDVQNIRKIDEVIDRIKQKAQQVPKGKWIKGTGYDDRRLIEERHPTKWDLDKATTDHPVYLQRFDGHHAVANSEALRLVNITKDTPDPKGGRFDRDPQTGELSGLLREEALTPFKKAIPPYTVADIKEGLVYATRQLAKWGITTAHDAYVFHNSMVAYQELLAEGKLPIRIRMMISGAEQFEFKNYTPELEDVGIKRGFGNDMLSILGTKFLCDGSMSGWTAALYEPYANQPNESGIIVSSREKITKGIVAAHKAGLRPMTHAIGDRAIDIVLDAIEEALQERPDPDHRMTVEHCSLPTEEAIDRMKRLGVIPSSSVGFIYELGLAHLVGLGEQRIKRYFPHRTYINKGIIATGNSDWFVTSANMGKQLYSIVTRKTYNGKPIEPSQAITVMDAIRVYTINGAYDSFEENVKGSIEIGKLADMVVLDRDILTVPENEILDMQIETTIVGGKVIYQKGG